MPRMRSFGVTTGLLLFASMTLLACGRDGLDAEDDAGVVAIGASATLYWMSTRESRAQHVAIVPTLHGAEAYAAWWF